LVVDKSCEADDRPFLGIGGTVRAVFLRKAIAGACAFAIAACPVVHVAAGERATRAEYEACQAQDEQQFKAAIEAITFKALHDGLSHVDYRAVVADGWRRGAIDGIIDKGVDLAISEVREETSWSELFRSLAFNDKAKELATAVAERVYRSDAIKAALEDLAAGIGNEVGKSLELAAPAAAEPSIRCLRAFLGPRYGSTVARVVASDAARGFRVDPAKGGAQVSAGAVLAQGSEGIAGTVILLVRRQLSNMAARVGQRLVGSVLGRLVSVVAGGVGLALIAKDVWDMRHGVLPIIAEEMKARSTKDRVQEELAKTAAEQLHEHVRDIAGKTAERVLEIWHEFRRAHDTVLDIAERHEAFKALLDATRPEQLPRLDEIVALVLASEGQSGVLRHLDDGTLHRALHTLSAAGMDIARETRSIDAALRWTTLAGERLPRVVDLELHKHGSPDDMTRADLGRLLGLHDRLAMVRLASVARDARDILFELGDGDLKNVARGLSEGELETLSLYVTRLERSASQRVLRVVAQSPARMQSLAPPNVRDAVLASRDQQAAVAMMLRSDFGLDPRVTAEDFQLVFEGKVSPILLWHKHPVAVVTLAVSALIVLLMLKGLLFRRR
jgi:hypothetical protein